MSRRRLPCRIAAIMAGRTGLVANVAVIKYPIGESICAMTGATVQKGIDMGGAGLIRLTGSECAIVTGLTFNS